MTLLVLHRPMARSHRRPGHSETNRSFRDGGLYVDRSMSGAVTMAWDKAQREGHEWVPLDNAELQLWFAGLPNYIATSTRCEA